MDLGIINFIESNDSQLTNPHQMMSYLDKYFNELQINNSSKNTYKRSLKRFFEFLHKNNITQPNRNDIRRFLSFLERENLKPTTIQNYLMVIRSFFQWLEVNDYYKDITKGVKSVRLSRNFKKDSLTEDQIKSLLSFDRTSIKDKRDYSIILLMLVGALRTIEISRAKIGDLRTRGKNTVLYIQGKGHLDKDDFINIPFEVESILRDYLSTRKKVTSDSPLFTSISNNNLDKEMTTRTISKIVKEKLIKAGLNSDRLTAHSLRHTAITLSLLNGNSIQDVQAFARHQCFSTTQIYAHNIDLDNNQCSSSIFHSVFDEK